MFPEANYVCRIWRLWWTGPRLMNAIKIFLTSVSRELLKYWRVNAGKWVSFKAYNSSVRETERGKKKNRWASEGTQRCYLFILITVSGDGEGVRNDGIELVSI